MCGPGNWSGGIGNGGSAWVLLLCGLLELVYERGWKVISLVYCRVVAVLVMVMLYYIVLVEWQAEMGWRYWYETL